MNRFKVGDLVITGSYIAFEVAGYSEDEIDRIIVLLGSAVEFARIFDRLCTVSLEEVVHTAYDTSCTLLTGDYLRLYNLARVV